MQRHTSFGRTSPTPREPGLGEQVAQALRPRNDKMDALLRRATGPQYDAASTEAKLTEALACRSKAP
jgi:hypothetical protein